MESVQHPDQDGGGPDTAREPLPACGDRGRRTRRARPAHVHVSRAGGARRRSRLARPCSSIRPGRSPGPRDRGRPARSRRRPMRRRFGRWRRGSERRAAAAHAHARPRVWIWPTAISRPSRSSSARCCRPGCSNGWSSWSRSRRTARRPSIAGRPVTVRTRWSSTCSMRSRDARVPSASSRRRRVAARCCAGSGPCPRPASWTSGGRCWPPPPDPGTSAGCGSPRRADRRHERRGRRADRGRPARSHGNARR